MDAGRTRTLDTTGMLRQRGASTAGAALLLPWKGDGADAAAVVAGARVREGRRAAGTSSAVVRSFSSGFGKAATAAR